MSLSLIDRLNDPEMYTDAVDDAIKELKSLTKERDELREGVETARAAKTLWAKRAESAKDTLEKVRELAAGWRGDANQMAETNFAQTYDEHSTLSRCAAALINLLSREDSAKLPIETLAGEQEDIPPANARIISKEFFNLMDENQENEEGAEL